MLVIVQSILGDSWEIADLFAGGGGSGGQTPVSSALAVLLVKLSAAGGEPAGGGSGAGGAAGSGLAALSAAYDAMSEEVGNMKAYHYDDEVVADSLLVIGDVLTGPVSPHQRDDAALSNLPASHLFGCAGTGPGAGGAGGLPLRADPRGRPRAGLVLQQHRRGRAGQRLAVSTAPAHQTRTLLQHDGPDRLGLWCKSGECF